MAKGYISEDEVRANLDSVGSLGALTQSRPRRDSLFRRTEDELISKPVLPVTQSTPAVAAVVSEPLKVIDLAIKTSAQVEPPHAEVLPEAKVAPIIARETVAEVKVVEVPTQVVAPQETSPVSAKAARYTERITFPITLEMRDGFEDLARKINRQRSIRQQRVTANTVMRVALEAFRTRFKFSDTDVANTDEELLNLILSRWK